MSDQGAGGGERLQKILARAGIAARRKVEELIAEGRVTVNGRVAALGDRADPERDAIKVDGKRVHPRTPHTYLLLNKPRAVMSTLDDPEGRPTVLELVPPALRKALVPVGRLDFLTEGLLLLTDDGDLAQRVAHPRYGCTKTYEVKVRGEPGERELARLREGMVLEGRRTAPAVVTRHYPGGRRPGPREGNRRPRGRGGAGARVARRRQARDEESGTSSWWRVELQEGRTRQIREMFQRVGHPVQRLRRVAIGPVSDPGLPQGAVRELTEAEVEALRKSSSGRSTPGKTTRRRRSAAPGGGGRRTARPGGDSGGRASGGARRPAGPGRSGVSGNGTRRPAGPRKSGGSGGRRPSGPRKGGPGGKGGGRGKGPRRGGGGR